MMCIAVMLCTCAPERRMEKVSKGFCPRPCGLFLLNFCQYVAEDERYLVISPSTIFFSPSMSDLSASISSCCVRFSSTSDCSTA